MDLWKEKLNEHVLKKILSSNLPVWLFLPNHLYIFVVLFCNHTCELCRTSSLPETRERKYIIICVGACMCMCVSLFIWVFCCRQVGQLIYAIVARDYYQVCSVSNLPSPLFCQVIITYVFCDHLSIRKVNSTIKLLMKLWILKKVHLQILVGWEGSPNII